MLKSCDWLIAHVFADHRCLQSSMVLVRNTKLAASLPLFVCMRHVNLSEDLSLRTILVCFGPTNIFFLALFVFHVVHSIRLASLQVLAQSLKLNCLRL